MVADSPDALARPAVALRGARLIDGAGGAPIDDAVLVVAGETIAAVGPAAATQVPPGARVVDLRGKTIMPGLVSNHAHVGLVDGVEVAPAHYNRANIARQLRQYEAYGVTTVTALGLNGRLFSEIRAEMHAGASPGADLFGAESGIGVPDGAPPAAMLPVGPDQLVRAASAAEARAAVRELAARGTDLVKLWLDDFGGSLPALMRPDVYRAVIDEAHRSGIPVAAHIHDLAAARALLGAGIDVIGHGVRDEPVDEAFLRAMEVRRAWYVPTLSLDEATFIYAERPPWMDEPFFQRALQPALRARLDDPAWRARTRVDPRSAAARSSLSVNLGNLRALHAAGARIGFGADSGATPLRIPGFAEHRELELMVEAGLTPLQAISIATRQGAALLGLDDRGVLAAGKRADFLVLDVDPSLRIAATQAIREVWHRGRIAAGPIDTFQG